MTEIPEQLRKKDFRFVLLKPKSKIPFEVEWQKTNNYSFNDPKLIEHLKNGGNYGVVGGYGNLRILDIDNPELIEHFDVMQTFTVKTGRGGRHFYFISDYDTNHVLVGSKGELRANNYQVVGANCIHPNGNTYEIIKDLPILEIEGKELRKIIEPYLRSETSTGEIDINKPMDHTRSGIEFGEVCKLIGKGWTKEKIFERMAIFDKWSHAPQQYQELTYKKAFDKENKKNETKIKVVRCFTSGIIGNDTFYQTVYLQNDGKFEPSVITSKGEIISVIDNEKILQERLDRKDWRTIQDEDRYFYFDFEGIRYKYYHELGFKDIFPIFTVDNDIISLIENKKLLHKEEIYDHTRQIIMDYWDHTNPYEYDVSTAFALQSNILRAIGKTLYSILQGREDTGKSTWQKAIARLQFNGKFTGKSTVASSVRQIHFLGINVNQDEFDKLSKEDKKVFMGVLNTGMYADGTYELCDMNKKKFIDQNTILFTFGQKSFSTNNLWGFDNTFLSRCYICICIRQGRKLKDINDIPPEEIQKFQDQRNNNFVYCVMNWKRIKKDIQDVKEELEKEGLFGRYTDMNSIILGIVKHFKGVYYLEVKKHLEEKLGVAKEEKSETKDAIVLEYIVNQFILKEKDTLKEKEEKILEVECKSILDYLITQLGIPDDAEDKPKPQSIGWILKNYNLLDKKENWKKDSITRRRIYVISKSKLVDILKRFGYNKLYTTLSSPSEASNPSDASTISKETKDTKDTKLYSSYNKCYEKIQKLHEKHGDNKFPKSELEGIPEKFITNLLNEGSIAQIDKEHFIFFKLGADEMEKTRREDRGS